MGRGSEEQIPDFMLQGIVCISHLVFGQGNYADIFNLLYLQVMVCYPLKVTCLVSKRHMKR